jgi:hypothetical protein
MRRATLVMALCFGAGCDGQTISYTGYYMADFFPLDGTERSWEYGNIDVELDYKLVSELDIEGSELSEDQRYRIFNLSTRAECLPNVDDCGAGWKYDYKIAASRGLGVTLHGYQLPGADPVVFESPIRLADVQMKSGDSRESGEVDGHTWTTTFMGVNSDCDQTMPVDWKCGQLVLESDPPGHWLAGTWWAAAGYNVVAFERTNDPGKWRVTDSPTYAP